MAQALFRSWFVDFDPVLDKALAAGHDIPEPLQPKAQRRLALGDKRKPLPPEVTGLFPDRFVYEEEVGWVPEGWVVKPAKEIYDISIGKTPPRKEPEWFSLDESNISWVSIRDMGNAEIFISSTSEYLTEEAVEKFRVVRVPKGSVILSFKLTIGRVAIAGSDLCTNEAIAHFKANSRSPGQFWTYLYLKDFNFDSLGSTSSIATAINSKIVKSMPIVVCGIDILDAFNEEVKPIFEKIAVNVDQVRNLVKLRDTLLPKLISGELQVNG
jgi:type I restriction enzyme S subunit